MLAALLLQVFPTLLIRMKWLPLKIDKMGIGAANTYWNISGTGHTTVFDSLNGKTFHNYNLGNETVSWSANFDASGKLTTSYGSNYLTIEGSLPAGNFGGTSWDAQPNKLLLSADLTGTNTGRAGTFGNFAIGFNTTFTGGWVADNLGLTGGSHGESLWLAGFSSEFTDLVKALDGKKGNGTLSSLFGSTKVIQGVFSVASVPLPGAVWLFGAGLMTFLAGRRKSRTAAFAG
jgi:hypothetical protein